MKYTTMLLAIMLATGTAYAGGNNNQNGPRGGNASASAIGVGSASARSNATALAGASAHNTTVVGVGVKNHNTNVAVGGSARQHQGQLQGQMQGQLNKQRNNQEMTYNEADGVHYSGGYTVRQKNVPAVSAPSIDPTAPCAIPLSGGGSGVGFGVSFGSAYIDEGCEQRELIRIGLTSGNTKAADKAAKLLNRQLDEALGEDEEDEAVASGPSSTNEGVFALTNY